MRDRTTSRTAPRCTHAIQLLLILVGGVGCGATDAGTESSVGTSPTASGPRATPCPDVPKPSPERYTACEEKGGKLVGRETDGCVRGYECVIP